VRRLFHTAGNVEATCDDVLCLAALREVMCQREGVVALCDLGVVVWTGEDRGELVDSSAGWRGARESANESRTVKEREGKSGGTRTFSDCLLTTLDTRATAISPTGGGMCLSCANTTSLDGRSTSTVFAKSDFRDDV